VPRDTHIPPAPDTLDQPLMLSVSGARGIVGATMTPAVAARYAAAFGTHVRAANGESHPMIVIGRDSRPSGAMLAKAAITGLVAVGCRVRDLGVVPTPTVGVMIDALGATGGMCVTASHNPIQWNGLKSLDSRGAAPPPDQAQQIIDRFKRGEISATRPAEDAVEQIEDATRTHIDRVLACVDVAAIRTRRFRVVLDSVNGAGCIAGRMLLEALGCEVVHVNGEPTGHFAHTPEPIAENLTDLADRVRADADAVIGFAQDPDADRLAIVDEKGSYIGEEYTLALCVLRMLEREGSGAVVANISTSRMVDDIASRFFGADVYRSAVGEANVVEVMQEHDSIIGGEGNGGVILPSVTWVRDSLGSMALVLELLASRRESLTDIVEQLPRYVMIKRKFDLSEIGGRDAVAGMLDRARQHFAGERVNDADGVRIDVSDGWVHLRPSNTEPIMRLIAEGSTRESAEDLITRVSDAVGVP